VPAVTHPERYFTVSVNETILNHVIACVRIPTPTVSRVVSRKKMWRSKPMLVDNPLVTTRRGTFFDRLGIKEVREHLANGDRDLHRWLEEYGIEPISKRR
jgi:hypothetical protein